MVDARYRRTALAHGSTGLVHELLDHAAGLLVLGRLDQAPGPAVVGPTRGPPCPWTMLTWSTRPDQARWTSGPLWSKTADRLGPDEIGVGPPALDQSCTSMDKESQRRLDQLFCAVGACLVQGQSLRARPAGAGPRAGPTAVDQRDSLVQAVLDQWTGVVHGALDQRTDLVQADHGSRFGPPRTSGRAGSRGRPVHAVRRIWCGSTAGLAWPGRTRNVIPDADQGGLSVRSRP